MSTTALPRPEIDYPSSDGKPMAENDWQLHAMLYAIGVLQAHFARRPDVYVSRGHAHLLRGGEYREVGGAGRVRGARGAGTQAHGVQAVGGAEGAGLRAGGGVAEDVEG